MCEFSDMIYCEGILKNEKRGEIHGSKRTHKSVTANLNQMGMPIKSIAQAIGIKFELVKPWLTAPIIIKSQFPIYIITKQTLIP